MSVRVDKAESLFTGLVGGNPPHLPNLVKEVNDNATITTECYDVQWNKPVAPRELSFIFVSALSGPEDTELTTVLIPAHTGVEIVDPTLAPAGGSDILVSGLLYHLDAMNRQSYPGSGTVATDIEGAVKGNLTGSTTHDGVAFDFNGTSGKIDIAKPTTLDDIFAGGGTVMFVVKADSDGEADLGHLATTIGSGTVGWAVMTANESGSDIDVRFEVAFSTTDGIWTAPGLTVGKYAVVTIRYDSDSVSNDPDIFIDETLATEAETQTPVGTYDGDTGEQLVIGNRDGDDRTLDGQVQRMLLFDRVLMTDEVVHVVRMLSTRPMAAKGGTWITETVATQTVTGTDTALTATLSNDPELVTVILKFDGLVKDRGATKTFTLGGSGNRTITWLASSGDAEDMDTNDQLEVTYRVA